jgi:hypothetical protein
MYMIYPLSTSYLDVLVAAIIVLLAILPRDFIFVFDIIILPQWPD